MASKDDLIPHILLPLPNVQEIQKPPNREERLKIIINNLERQHNAVKSRIVQAAKRKRDLAVVQHSVDEMEVDPPRGRSLPPQTAAMDQMFASLNTPYKESMGDPYLRPDASIPPPSPGTRQSTPPPQVLALDQIGLYEKHASRTRKFHKDALEREQKRRTSASGSSSAGPWNVSRTHSASGTGARGVASPSTDPRRPNPSPRESPRVNASPIDISRDPRLRR